MNIAYNMDCLAAMREMPDKAFDLAVVDPPYGDGNADNEEEHRNQRGRFDRYNIGKTIDHLNSSCRKRENAVARTGGTWAEKYAKKS